MNKQEDSFAVIRDAPVPPDPPTPNPPTPIFSDPNMQRILTVAFVIGYFAILVMLHVYWLSFQHPELQSVALIGDGTFASAATTILGHYFGATSTVNGVATGVRLSRR